MKIIHYLAWISFLVILSTNIYNAIELNYVEHIPFNLFQLQFAKGEEGKALLQQWRSIPTSHGRTVLHEARLTTEWDFLFLLSYVTLLIFISYNRMQREPSPGLNNLLRLNFPLAILTGIFNAIGNSIELIDMKPYNIGKCFCSAFGWHLAKFILGAWILIIIIISVPKKKSPPTPR